MLSGNRKLIWKLNVIVLPASNAIGNFNKLSAQHIALEREFYLFHSSSTDNEGPIYRPSLK